MTLPALFETYTQGLMGPLYNTLKQGLGEEPPVSIRLNPFKTTVPPEDNTQATSVPWCSEGMYLDGRPAFTFDPLLHAGCYYVQEASSMFTAHVLRQLVRQPVMMLDLCAAPGGKTTTARSVLPAGSLLMTNEPMKLRASVLSENMQKFGHPDVMVTNNFPQDYARAGMMFDVILADVPCSGEGMFRKDEGAIAEWSVQHVEKCRLLQRSIIKDIWPCLREGGILIYSTCTFNAHENEENVNWIASELGADFVAIDIQPQWNITGSLIDSHPVYRFIPGKTRGEGLFMAVLRKHGEHEPLLQGRQQKGGKEPRRQRKDRGGMKSVAGMDELKKQWINADTTVVMRKDTLRAIPTAWLAQYEQAEKSLHVIHAGVTLGMQKGRDIIPDTSLALSTICRRDAFSIAELSYETAIAYLRKEAVQLPPDTPKGFVLVTYRGQALGWVKNIGNRANNLYPQEWKIKSSHTPVQTVQVLND